MALLKDLGRKPAVQETIGRTLAGYLKLVRSTNRFTIEPQGAYDTLTPLQPFIGAMWHGQHFMAPYLRRPQDRAASLVSRSSDGELNAIALRELGIRAIRGSGARGRDQRLKGGSSALRAMLQALQDGENMFLTADIPKIARICGTGVVLLARMSGRPIVPVAVATSRRLEFNSWDRASIGLPAGRGAIVAGEAVHVAHDADEATLEAARLAVEQGLDLVHERAFAIVGRTDPGIGLRRVPAPGEAAEQPA